VGLERAIQKRPVSEMDVERLVNEIEDQAVTGEGRECSSIEIGEMILEKLAELDRVAYIRFASVCRHYENLDEFVKEIKKLGKPGGKNDRKSRKKVSEN
jgi:transcriptional repressor NrdR